MTPSPQFVALAERLLPCQLTIASGPSTGCILGHDAHQERCAANYRDIVATALESQFNAGLEKGADYIQSNAAGSRWPDKIRVLKTPAGKQEEW